MFRNRFWSKRKSLWEKDKLSPVNNDNNDNDDNLRLSNNIIIITAAADIENRHDHHNDNNNNFELKITKKNGKKIAKKLEKNSNFFTKVRSSFVVKAKSFDQTQLSSSSSSGKKEKSDGIFPEELSPQQSHHYTDQQQQRSIKTSKLSFRRIFGSHRSKSMSIPPSTLDNINSKEVANLSTSSRFSSGTSPENDGGGGTKPQTASTASAAAVTITQNNSRLGQHSSVSYYGIANHGNTCYINSILQCLNSIDSLAKYFVLNKFKTDLSRLTKLSNSQSSTATAADSNCKRQKETVSFLFSFALFLKSLWMSNLKCESISSDFKFKLSSVDRTFHSNDQQDAQEFLLFILNFCHETLKIPVELELSTMTTMTAAVAGVDGVKRRGNSNKEDRIKPNNIGLEAEKMKEQNCSIIHQLFATYQQLTITCPGCGMRQYKIEPHLCLSLPVPAKSMEPLYYCFVEKDGSQICAAMWINTISLVQYVRANIAHKFRVDIKNVLIMVVTESGFGKCYQDSESALELLSVDSSSQSSSNNIWSGVVAIEIASVMSNSSCNEYDSPDSQPYQAPSVKQMKNHTLPTYKTPTNNSNDSRRQSGVYDNLPMDDDSDSQKIRDDNSLNKHSRYQNADKYRSNFKYKSYNYSNENFSNLTSPPVNLVIVHVEEIIENSFVSGWRRFSAPVALLVRKEIEFLDLEKLILSQLETAYHCNIQSKLKLHLRFWVWDGLNNTDLEITNDHQFPLLTESVESIISLSENFCTIRMVAVWSPNNAARLLQIVFANFRLSHSLGRDVSKMNMYNPKSRSQSLTLNDAWPAIEENGSVELVMRASLARQSENSESRNISLEDCLKAYVSEEVLDAKDAWKCPNCHSFQRATMSTTIYSLPEILILHLKRFQSYSLFPNSSNGKPFRDHEDMVFSTVGGNDSHNNTGLLFHENNSNNKLNILVDYPLSGLDMRTYLSKAAETDLKKQSPKKSNNTDYFYDLIAVCNHQGTLSTGHYTAFCRSSVDYKWRLFNDEIVRELTADKVIQPNAYILFYQRRSTIVSHELHWSSQLDLSKSSNDSHMTHTTSKSSINGYINQVNNSKNLQRKSDPPKRRAPYQTKRISDIKTNDAFYTSQHSNLRRPLPLDNNCNSLSNNTPILHDEDENDNESTNSSTSNENVIPTSITVRPLRLRTKSTDHSSRISQTRI